ncbi:MAG TPA: HAD family phosphatase [Pseudomonadales bacterium]|nr:HAD family phosphatase [Pseudomonadales bacterium]
MDIEVILFDLGGVLVELTGVGTMMAWSRLDEDEIWHRWLTSRTVRQFESGRSRTEDFARDMVAEFDLETTPEAFIEAFIAWPRGLFDGTIELLDSLSGRYHLSCLSNTNHLHWARFERETKLLSSLHSHFASHQLGMMKPDIEIYTHVIEQLGVQPARILFLDDNQMNVDAARSAGMHAELTRGLTGVTRQLSRLGL